MFHQTPTEQEIDTDSQHRITFNQDSILQLNSLQIYDFLSQLLNSVKFQPLNLTLMKALYFDKYYLLLNRFHCFDLIFNTGKYRYINFWCVFFYQIFIEQAKNQ